LKRLLLRRFRFVLAALAAALLAACFGKSTETQFTTPPQALPVDPVVQRPFEPVPFTLRALLGWQYRNAIQDLLGPAAAAVVTPPPDTTVNGWDAIGAAQLSLSSTAVDLYETSAQSAAGIATNDAASRDAVLGCTPQSSADAECMNQFVSRFGRRAWRRSLSADEQTAWAAIGGNAAAAYGDFYKGASFVVAGLLQSPNFLYQIEIGEADPTSPGRLELSGYELATRLSFFLTGSTPSEELLAAAERGELQTQEGVRFWAEQLVNDPRSRDAVSHFFDEFLQLRDLPQVSKDPMVFPSFTPALAAAMRNETHYLLDSLTWDGGDFRQFFDADYTFVNSDLAALYGLPDAPPCGQFVRAELPSDSRRGGFLGQAAFLSLMAHPATSSPTLRGKFVREKLMCQTIPPPPPNVDTNLPNTEGMTTRQKLLAHRQNPSCAACHVLMDDIGLGLENFDAIGQYRTTESGQPIDASSELDDLGAFTGARELGALLRGDPSVTLCLERNLFRAATGHVDTLGESGPLNDVYDKFAASGFQLKEALVEIAASDAFRFGADQTGSAP
jgi:hypothetical protein